MDMGKESSYSTKEYQLINIQGQYSQKNTIRQDLSMNDKTNIWSVLGK